VKRRSVFKIPGGAKALGALLRATPTEVKLLEVVLRALRDAKRNRRQLRICIDWWLSGGDGLYFDVERSGPCEQHEISGGEMVRR
jgi:hypothetical protein